MADSRLRHHWAELEGSLRDLRTTFPSSERGHTARTLYDEFLAANEFGLVLETLCDCLLEAEDSVINSDILATISRLHAKMGVDDNCTTLLRL